MPPIIHGENAHKLIVEHFFPREKNTRTDPPDGREPHPGHCPMRRRVWVVPRPLLPFSFAGFVNHGWEFCPVFPFFSPHRWTRQGPGLLSSRSCIHANLRRCFSPAPWLGGPTARAGPDDGSHPRPRNSLPENQENPVNRFPSFWAYQPVLWLHFPACALSLFLFFRPLAHDLLRPARRNFLAAKTIYPYRKLRPK